MGEACRLVRCACIAELQHIPCLSAYLQPAQRLLGGLLVLLCQLRCPAAMALMCPHRHAAGSLKGTAAPAPAKDHPSHPPKLAVSPSMDHLLSLSTPASRVQSSSSMADGAGGSAAQLLARAPMVLPR
jgi:hypothetical protein